MSELDRLIRHVKGMTSALTVFKTPYDAGYNCGCTGPTESNCNFMWFATPDLTREWDRGKADGDKYRRRNAVPQDDA